MAEKSVIDFYAYPPIGSEDWRYAFQTARIRALETRILPAAALHDMANASSFEQAADLLATSEYALRNFAEVEDVLRLARSAVRNLFERLIIDKPIVELFKARDDFANLRLALRRTLTEKPLGNDYSGDGNICPEIFAEAFENGNYGLLPDYMQQAIEQAVLAYYQQKDIRRIDYSIDGAQAGYNLKMAHRLKSLFLIGLFRIQIDLANMRTVLRLKFVESELKDVFLQGGFVELEKFERGLDVSYETIGSLFFATPYYQLVETGTGYITSDKSFLRLERQCEGYLMGYLKSTARITAGPQPVIAYLLMKENEIRNVRLILTAKKNFLDTQFILDRISNKTS